jgi:hypothetical protein
MTNVRFVSPASSLSDRPPQVASRLPPAPIDDAVARRLARSNGALTAWELQQGTQERALQRRVAAIGL